LAEYFEGLDVKEIRLVKNSDGRSKGFAFVEFGTAEALTNSLCANEQMFNGRKITVEVQPPRAGGERTYGGSASTFDRDEDKSRWGPSSGSGFASQLGSQAGSRTFESSGRRDVVPSSASSSSQSRGFEDDRQWRGKETSYQPPVSQQRPKIDVKPRTVTDEIGKLASEQKQSSSEDPFGGALNPEKAKKQAEIQAQREAEASAKHKLNNNNNSSSGNRYGRDGERDGHRGQHRQDESSTSSPWRTGPKTLDGDHHHNNNSQDGEKYRFNRGSHPYDQRAPQKNDNQKSTNNSNPSANTFQSLAGNNKW